MHDSLTWSYSAVSDTSSHGAKSCLPLVVCRNEGDGEAGEEVRRDLGTEHGLVVVVEGNVLYGAYGAYHVSSAFWPAHRGCGG